MEKWTKRELEILKDKYSNTDNNILSKQINHSAASIVTKANRDFNLKKLKTCRYCKVNLNNQPNNSIVCKNCRTEHIRNHKKEYYLKNRNETNETITKKIWVKEELEYLKKNYSTKRNEELSKYLGHSIYSIVTKANHYLKLKKLKLCMLCGKNVDNLANNVVTCSTCKIKVKKKYKKDWHIKNREKILQRIRQWKINNPERKKELDKIWRTKNAERKRYNDRAYHEKLRKIENERRVELGLPLIGNYYQKEKELLLYIKNLFPDINIISHDRKILGNRLELDIFIPSLNLAFEYQGEQHFDPNIKFYFKKPKDFYELKKRDELKRELCKKNSITLIEFCYYEKLSEQLVLKKLFANNIFNDQSTLVEKSLKINEIKRETKEELKW